MSTKCRHRIIYQEAELGHDDCVNTEMPPAETLPSDTATTEEPSSRTNTSVRRQLHPNMDQHNMPRQASGYEIFMLSLPCILPILMITPYLLLLTNLVG